MDLVELWTPYLRLAEVDALACTCTHAARIAAPRHHAALRLWAELEKIICHVFLTWDREDALEWWEDSDELWDSGCHELYWAWDRRINRFTYAVYLPGELDGFGVRRERYLFISDGVLNHRSYEAEKRAAASLARKGFKERMARLI